MYDITAFSSTRTVRRMISDRECEVLKLISQEYTTKQIASTLYLSPHTVDSHKKNLKLKLDVKNSAGLVRRGFEMGILMPGMRLSY